jgi:hypothetical protein
MTEPADPVAAALGVIPQDPDGLPPPPDQPDGDLPGRHPIAATYTRVDWYKLLDGKPDPVDWLLEPILEAGTINALFSKVGAGKSLLALDWAVQLARAGYTVVYIDEENRLADLADRIRAMGAAAGELGELGGLWFYSFASLPPLDGPAGGVHLLDIAEAADAALVVLDTTTRMVHGRENHSDTFLALYRYSLAPLKKRGITVLRLDHPGKDEERGQRAPAPRTAIATPSGG